LAQERKILRFKDNKLLPDFMVAKKKRNAFEPNRCYSAYFIVAIFKI